MRSLSPITAELERIDPDLIRMAREIASQPSPVEMVLSHPDFAARLADLREQQRHGTDTSGAQAALVDSYRRNG